MLQGTAASLLCNHLLKQPVALAPGRRDLPAPREDWATEALTSCCRMPEARILHSIVLRSLQGSWPQPSYQSQ